jgi:3-methyladenine DNA glycosylase AlkD
VTSDDATPPGPLTAAGFIERLHGLASATELEKIQRYFKTGDGEYGAGDAFIGVRMGQVFSLADACKDLPLSEIERLLESPIHEARAGAVKVMARQASDKRTPDARRRELFDLYLRRIDRINNWDLVDLGAWDVIGRYLLDKPRDVLADLARSANIWERRTAILATLAFLRRGDLDDTYAIALMLLDDPHDLVQKPVGACLREAGKHDRGRLSRFLDEHASTMPRTTLRFAIEHFEPDERTRYLGMPRG